MLSSRKLFIVDPFNEEHQKLLNDFDNYLGIVTPSSSFVDRIKSVYTKEEYLYYKKNSNEVGESLIYMENNQVIDTCHLEIEKDIKACSLSFAPIDKPLRRKKFIELVTNYALEEKKLVEVFVKVEKEDKLTANLAKLGYEDLGKENGITIFLKEKAEDEVLRKAL